MLKKQQRNMTGNGKATTFLLHRNQVPEAKITRYRTRIAHKGHTETYLDVGKQYLISKNSYKPLTNLQAIPEGLTWKTPSPTASPKPQNLPAHCHCDSLSNLSTPNIEGSALLSSVPQTVGALFREYRTGIATCSTEGSVDLIGSSTEYFNPKESFPSIGKEPSFISRSDGRYGHRILYPRSHFVALEKSVISTAASEKPLNCHTSIDQWHTYGVLS